MSKSKTPNGEKLDLRDRIVQAGVSSFQIRTRSERGNLTIIVRVEVSRERKVLVDRDHDHLLREFMEARMSDVLESSRTGCPLPRARLLVATDLPPARPN